MGRLTQERIKQIVAAAANGASKAQLIEVAGVEKTTWWRWKKRAEEGDEPYAQMFRKIARAAVTGGNEHTAIELGSVQKRSRANVVKRENPKLYRSVLAGDMTVNAAYTLLKGKRRVSIPIDPDLVPVALSRHFKMDELRMIADRLTDMCGES